MRIATNGWLYDEGDGPTRVTYVRSVRTCSLLVPQPMGLVWHATGTVGGPGFAARLAHRIQTYRAGVDRPASFHAVVARDGTIVQCISLAVGSWHVGRPGEIGGRLFDNVNRATIGIELENAGVLNEIGGHLYAWPFYRNPHAPERERRANPKCRVPRARGVLFSGRPSVRRLHRQAGGYGPRARGRLRGPLRFQPAHGGLCPRGFRSPHPDRPRPGLDARAPATNSR